MKKYNLCLSILLILFILGCNHSKPADVAEDGLVITRITYGLGGELDRTLVTYSFTLSNKTSKAVEVISVSPIMSEELTVLLEPETSITEINQTIAGNTSEEIKGSFYLDTKGLDKEGIMELGIELREFSVASKQVISK